MIREERRKLPIFRRLSYFFVGFPPSIIFENGEIRHELPKKQWDQWKARFETPEYDWRNHSGLSWNSKDVSQPDHEAKSHSRITESQTVEHAA
jgi:hypothetical protein